MTDRRDAPAPEGSLSARENYSRDTATALREKAIELLRGVHVTRLELEMCRCHKDWPCDIAAFLIRVDGKP